MMTNLNTKYNAVWPPGYFSLIQVLRVAKGLKETYNDTSHTHTTDHYSYEMGLVGNNDRKPTI